MSEQKITRIPVQHLIYVKEYIRTGDQERAYGKAYPSAQPQSRGPAASRLSKRPEILRLIKEKQHEAVEKGFAAAEAEAAERYKEEFLSIHERRAELARIVRRQARMNKYYKVKEDMRTMDVPVDSPFAILRAIELDTKLEAEYFAKKPAAVPKDSTKWSEQEKCRLHIYIDQKCFDGKEEDHLSDEEFDFLLKESLTNPDVHVVGPTSMNPKLESMGCTVHRDTETGRYEIHCPADRLIAREVNGQMKYYELEEGDDPDQLTFLNNDSPQTAKKQHEEEKSLMRHSEDEVANKNPGSYRDKIPDSQSSVTDQKSPITNDKPPIRRYIYPIKRGGYPGDEWVSLDRVIMDYWDYYLKYQNMDNMRLHESIVRLSRSRNRPPEERRELELETGWEFHPQTNAQVRRIRM